MTTAASRPSRAYVFESAEAARESQREFEVVREMVTTIRRLRQTFKAPHARRVILRRVAPGCELTQEQRGLIERLAKCVLVGP